MVVDVLFSATDGTEQLRGGLVSANNFTFLGVRAALGRAIEPRDSESELLTDILDQYTYAAPRLGVVITTIFAVAALVLVGIGVFSIIADTVSRRTHDIGIRMARRARRTDVLQMILRSTLGIVGIGILVGLAASLILTRLFANQLFGITPQDPLTVASVVGLLMLVGALARYIPARAATRVDPMIALRHD